MLLHHVAWASPKSGAGQTEGAGRGGSDHRNVIRDDTRPQTVAACNQIGAPFTAAAHRGPRVEERTRTYTSRRQRFPGEKKEGKGSAGANKVDIAGTKQQRRLAGTAQVKPSNGPNWEVAEKEWNKEV